MKSSPLRITLGSVLFLAVALFCGDLALGGILSDGYYNSGRNSSESGSRRSSRKKKSKRKSKKQNDKRAGIKKTREGRLGKSRLRRNNRDSDEEETADNSDKRPRNRFGVRRDRRAKARGSDRSSARDNRPRGRARLRRNKSGGTDTRQVETQRSTEARTQGRPSRSGGNPRAALVAKKRPRPAARRPGSAKRPKTTAGAPSNIVAGDMAGVDAIAAIGDFAGDGSGAKGAKVHANSHVLLLKNGTKLTCSLIFKGKRSVVVLTDQGEKEFMPDEIEEIRASDEEREDPVFVASVTVDGHHRLQAPEPTSEDETKETPTEEGVESLIDPSASVLDAIHPEAGAGDNESAQPTTQESKKQKAVDQTPKRALPSLPAPSPMFEPAVKPKVQPRPAPALRTPGAKAPSNLGAPGSVQARKLSSRNSRLEALRAARARAQQRSTGTTAGEKTAKPKKHGLVDLLKALSTEEGKEGLLEEIRTNPDFYKQLDVPK